jgi:hypothetical protein
MIRTLAARSAANHPSAAPAVEVGQVITYATFMTEPRALDGLN